MNRVTLIGNLGGDMELRFTQGGEAVGNVSLCTTEKWNDKNGQKQEKSEWHSLVIWGKIAQTLQPYLTKGKKIAVEGSIQTRSWEKDGVKHYKTEIRTTHIELLGDPKGDSRGDSKYGGSAPNTRQQQARDEYDPSDPDQELPF